MNGEFYWTWIIERILTQTFPGIVKHQTDTVLKKGVLMSLSAAWDHGGESGRDSRRSHPAFTGRGYTDPAGGGRDTHSVQQQWAAANHTERPGAPIPAETVTQT